MTDSPHYLTSAGTRISFSSVALRIAMEHPSLVGEHRDEQLAALGMLADCRCGAAPWGLPDSFSDYQP